VKEATGSLDVASAIAARTPLALLSGDDSLTLPIGAVGGVGVISVLSNLVPRRIAALCGAMGKGDWASARSVHLELLGLARGLLALDVNPVPVKTALALLGRDSGAVRLPLAEADETTREAIRGLVDRCLDEREAAVATGLSAIS
jgi:4-hydroxy-tetrahydrodipicolinate synthase